MRRCEEAAGDGPFVGFRQHLRVEVVPGEAVYLLSPRGVRALHGRQAEAIAPLLDGTRTLNEVLREVRSRVSPVEAGRIIGELARVNLVGYRHAPREGSDVSAAAYWELAGLDGGTADAALARTTVRLITVGGVDGREARAACEESGLRVLGPADGPEPVGPGDGGSGGNVFSLVLCDDYLAPDLGPVDAWHRERRLPWLLARPYGDEPWAGPVFRPGEGACWSCLAHRVRAHRRAEIPLQRAIGTSAPLPRPVASLAAGRGMGLRMAVLEAAKWLAGLRNAEQDSVCVLDTLSLRTGHHPVRRRPQCPECGDPGLVAERGRRPVVLVSRPKAAGGGSNDRALTPEQVLERYGHLVGPVTGVVREVRRDTRLPEGVNCYVSGHNLALGARTLAELRGGLRTLSGGKGVTPLEAEVGALCEAVERYSATRQGDEPTVFDTLEGLGEQAIHPNACQLFDERQFRDRERWNASVSAFHQVCAPFAADRPVEWTPVWSLTAGTHRLLPTSMLYFGHDAAPDGSLPCADSNGNAAGSSLEDAVVQGFLELVERDAVALWWYNRTRQPAVDLDAFDEPWLAGVRDAYARMHRELWVLDLTADFGIPVMAAVSRRTDKPAEDITLGFGAHFDPRLALRRALTEMGQLTAAVAGVGRDGPGYGDALPDLLSWWTGATIRNQPYLVADQSTPPLAPGDYGHTPRRDLHDDVEAARKLVEQRGMELLVLDQTRPDVGIPVVRAIVPGLRHFWARFAPGRLFDIPVTLGRLDRPTRYENLNPIPLFV
ncbi:TOMM precursor leader peptide-binding protein [Streptomyces glaucosporus]|uniref:TOMM leader peptide-binding protein n=1 Tax=Streptomyces glaucosporus TaxID=284044 RepID=A0ABP5UL43_9ACTN